MRVVFHCPECGRWVTDTDCADAKEAAREFECADGPCPDCRDRQRQQELEKGVRITAGERRRGNFSWVFSQQIEESRYGLPLRVEINLEGPEEHEAGMARMLLSKDVRRFLKRKARGGQ